MSSEHILGEAALSIEDIWALIHHDKKITLSKVTYEKIDQCRTYLDSRLEREKGLIYGINTGFGSLCNIQISKDDRRLLQEKLIQSHACGTGDPVPDIIVKLIQDHLICIALRINTQADLKVKIRSI